jgi:hypothetical protein
MFDKYKPIELPATGAEGSKKSRGPADDRLPAEERVLGITFGEHARAVPLARLEKLGECAVLPERIGDRDCVILWYGSTRTAVAFRPLARPPQKEKGEPRLLTLNAAAPAISEAPFLDKETRTRWDIAGRAVEGELKGWTLDWVDSVQVKWFAWAAEYPRTSIAGK